MDDIDSPNTRAGYCPVCAQRADIWEATQGQWHCCFCNWKGVKPDREPHYKIVEV